MQADTGVDAVAYYDDAAERFAQLYDSISFEAVHPTILGYLPRKGRALDIGAGSGRDARALAERGLDVTAVEPAAGFVSRAAPRDTRIRWVNDRLPELAGLKEEVGDYDFILCSAVLMLLPPGDLAPSFKRMERLLARSGLVWANIRSRVAGEPGGIFHDHSDDVLLGAAMSAGLECIEWIETDDALGRGPRRWRSFLFSRKMSSI